MLSIIIDIKRQDGKQSIKQLNWVQFTATIRAADTLENEMSQEPPTESVRAFAESHCVPTGSHIKIYATSILEQNAEIARIVNLCATQHNFTIIDRKLQRSPWWTCQGEYREEIKKYLMWDKLQSEA